jgi:hypothetical protein
MLYVGMALASFAWHVEDQWLYSINYHHFGAPKTWYGAPAADAELLERAVAGLAGPAAVAAEGGRAATSSATAAAAATTTTTTAIRDPSAPYAPAAAALVARARAAASHAGLSPAAADALAARAAADAAAAALAAKTTLACPARLRAAGVRVCRAVHCAGEFIVTFPRAYHAGFSHGLNVGEAVNFATGDWHAWAEAAAERAGRRLGGRTAAAVLPHERLLAREAARLGREVEAFEEAEEGGGGGGGRPLPPPHPLDPRPRLVGAAAAAAPAAGGPACPPPARGPPLLVPQSAEWSTARCFLRLMRRLRAARAAARARGVAEVVVVEGGGGGVGAAGAGAAAGEVEEEEELAPAQPSPACARCGAACFGVVAMEDDGGGGGAEEVEVEEEEEAGQLRQADRPAATSPLPSPLCARCVLAEPRCRGAGWALVVDAEVPALDALARRWERGELGGHWLRRRPSGARAAAGVARPASADAAEPSSRKRGRGGGSARGASPAPADEDEGGAPTSATRGLFLHETGLGPGLPDVGGGDGGEEEEEEHAGATAAPAPTKASLLLPGDVPAAWLALLRAPSGVAAAPVARRMAAGLAAGQAARPG